MKLTNAMLLFLAALALPMAAQDSQSQAPQTKAGNEAGITREEAAKIIQELQMIRMLLQKEIDAKATNSAGNPNTNLPNIPFQNISPERVLATTLGKHTIGSDKAPLTLVEFVDLQCSFCIQFHNEILPELRRKYIDTGKLKFAVLNFPLPSHVYAAQAAAFARCAEPQGKYWQVQDAFLGAPQVATPDAIQKIANDNQLDPKRLDQCLKDPDTTAEVSREANVGHDLGVYGTPTFFLGRSSVTGVTGRIIERASSLEAKIQELLKQGESRPDQTPQAR
jgi:protein-disulfide isomerase